MNVTRNSWHARLYIWWYQQKYGATKPGYVEKYDDNGEYLGFNVVDQPNLPARTNLCPYMRAILFWSWLRWLFIDGIVGKVRVHWVVIPALLIEIPRWLGIVSYSGKMFVLILYSVAVGFGLFVALMFGLTWLRDKTALGRGIDAAGKGAREFGGLVGAYARSGHDRICPEIEFKEKP